MKSREESRSRDNEIYPRHIYTNETKIQNPKKDYIYHIKNKFLPNGEVIVTFIGEINNVSYLDVSTFLYQKKSTVETDHFRFDGCPYFDAYFIYKKSLPVSTFKIPMEPSLYYLKNEPKQLQAIYEMQIQLNNYGDNYFNLKNIKLIPVKDIKICNTELKKECQELIRNIPVVSGQYPIFVEDKRPNYRFLQILYNKFINYNDNARLTSQYKKSTDWCTARAHFVTTFLNQYGISNIKLFKEWAPGTWKKIYPNIKSAWKYHCATMIIDSDNRKWVWDPWVGLNQHLLTLDQWSNRSDEPTPIKLLLANSTIIGDYLSGNSSRSEFLTDSSFEPYVFNPFQMMWSSAIPNPPERPITHRKQIADGLPFKNANRFFAHLNQIEISNIKKLSPQTGEEINSDVTNEEVKTFSFKTM